MRRMLQGRAGVGLAFLLGLLVATAGTATAARLITGKQIKDGSISTRDLSNAVRAQLAKAGIPGPQGPPGKDGAANPNADNAARLGGLTPDAFLHSDRVLSTSLDPLGKVGALLFADPSTGLEVRVGTQSRVRLVNTNSDTELDVSGAGSEGSTVQPVFATIAPGTNVEPSVATVTPHWLSLMVIKNVSDGSVAPRLQLTCGYVDTGPGHVVLSCVGLH
jgi:hypothetical protein